MSDETDTYAQDTAQIESDRQSLTIEHEKKAESENLKKTVEHYLTTHSQDAWLISGLTGIEEQLVFLQAKQKEIQEKEEALKKKLRKRYLLFPKKTERRDKTVLGR